MQNLLFILLVVMFLSVVSVLGLGLIGMIRGGEFNEKYGNKLMRLRVMLQGATIVVFMLFMWVASRG